MFNEENYRGLEYPKREATDELIDEVIAHLDNELEIGAVKMTVEMDDRQEEHSKVSHKCSKAYGRDATTMIAQLDMIHDMYLADMEE